jgi:hypothetical protein
MPVMIFQPQGTGTTHKEGTILVQSPRATGWGESNYVIDDYVSNLPTTGDINTKYEDRLVIEVPSGQDVGIIGMTSYTIV